MRVSGRKLRLAVGAGIASLMLLLGVSSVGATAPQTVGLVNVIVVGAQASASNSTNVLTTNTTYRDAVRITTATGGGAIGIFVDGVAMFDSRDTFSYSNANGKDADPTAGHSQETGQARQ